jgi:kinesin family protein 6/9
MSSSTCDASLPQRSAIAVFARLRPLPSTAGARAFEVDDGGASDGEAAAAPSSRGALVAAGGGGGGGGGGGSSAPLAQMLRCAAVRGAGLSFRFSGIFPEAASQDDVYAAALAPLVADFVQRGVSVSALAYGQTGSGKTYSMVGGARYKSRGLVPRAITDIFAALAASGGGGGGTTTLLASYAQVYNESLYDLLDGAHGEAPIEAWARVRVQEGRDGAVMLSGLRQFEVASERDALNLLFLGNVRRATAETPHNAASSRSHCIFTLQLERGGGGSGGGCGGGGGCCCGL